MSVIQGYHFDPKTGETSKCDVEIKYIFDDEYSHFATVNKGLPN